MKITSEQKDRLHKVIEKALPLILDPEVLRLCMAFGSKETKQKMVTIVKSYLELEKYADEAYLARKCKSNNWLKMHGYPMRRRKRR